MAAGVRLTFPSGVVKIGHHPQTEARTPLVAAKFRLPAAESYGLVRLDAMMNRLWGRRLGLVVAPAGSGKTTLLARVRVDR